MSKELEALKQVKNFLGYNYCSVDLPNELRTIEQALQRLEAIDNTNPSEALESWNKIGDILNKYCNDKGLKFSDSYNIGQELQVIKQALLKAQEQEKVLDVIKKKNVMVFLLKVCKSIDEYNFHTSGKDELTQEEFDLLKRYANEQD